MRTITGLQRARPSADFRSAIVMKPSDACNLAEEEFDNDVNQRSVQTEFDYDSDL